MPIILWTIDHLFCLLAAVNIFQATGTSILFSCILWGKRKSLSSWVIANILWEMVINIPMRPIYFHWTVYTKYSDDFKLIIFQHSLSKAKEKRTLYRNQYWYDTSIWLTDWYIYHFIEFLYSLMMLFVKGSTKTLLTTGNIWSRCSVVWRIIDMFMALLKEGAENVSIRPKSSS